MPRKRSKHKKSIGLNIEKYLLRESAISNTPPTRMGTQSKYIKFIDGIIIIPISEVIAYNRTNHCFFWAHLAAFHQHINLPELPTFRCMLLYVVVHSGNLYAMLAFFVGQKTAWNFFKRGFCGSKISSIIDVYIYKTTGLFVSRSHEVNFPAFWMGHLPVTKSLVGFWNRDPTTNLNQAKGDGSHGFFCSPIWCLVLTKTTKCPGFSAG